MSIQFLCNDCGRAISAPDGTSGRKVRCPGCQKVQVIPAAAPAGASDLGGNDFAGGPAPAKARGGSIRSGSARAGQSGGATATCAVCGNTFPAGTSCPVCRPPRFTPDPTGRFDAGKLVKTTIVVLVTLAIVGGIVYVILMLMKQGANTGGSYVQGVVDARTHAHDVIDTVNLSTLAKDLQMFVSANDRFPDSLDELAKSGVSSELFKSIGDPTQRLKMVTGVTPKSPPDTVVIYDPMPAKATGKCFAITVGGQVVQLTLDQVKGLGN